MTGRLKNITAGSITLAMFDTASPMVNGASQNVILTLQPGEDVDQTAWLVSNEHDLSYNAYLIDGYIQNNILTLIP